MPLPPRPDNLPLRAALIGARRSRQGLGPFIARDLVRLGCDVVAITTTCEATLATAARDVLKYAGIRPACYNQVDRMLAEASPDLVFILTPPEYHAEYLELALRASCHTVCEKPLLWGGRTADRVAALVERFAERGLILAENCQWPDTLIAYDALYPGILATATALDMRLTPDTVGASAVRDCLSHVISVAQAVMPADATIQGEPEVIVWPAKATHVKFDFGTRAQTLSVTGQFVLSNLRPRPAHLSFDGHVAQRLVDPANYHMHLSDGIRSVPLDDPLKTHLAKIIDRVEQVSQRNCVIGDLSLVRRAAAFDSVVAAVMGMHVMTDAFDSQ